MVSRIQLRLPGKRDTIFRAAESRKSGRFRRNARIGSAVLLWLCFVHLAGCGARPTTSWTALSSGDLLHQVRRPVTAEVAISGSARISSETHEGIRKGRTYFALHAPNKLLLEAVTPSDETIAVLVTNGDRFMGFEVGDARCRTGSPCAENVGQLFPIALDGVQLIRLLHGRPPLIVGETAPPLKLKSPARMRVVIDNGRETVQTLDFSPDGRDVIATEIRKKGAIYLRIEYAEYHDLHEKIRMPGILIVDDPQRGSRVIIRVTDINLFEPRAATFATQCPVGKLIMPMTCGPDSIGPQ